MNNNNFYNDIPSFTNFRNILNEDMYRSAPADWLIIISDIRNSTEAIENNKYKDVNTIGASSIISVLNTLNENEDIPFVFGGDGASFLIPEKYFDQVAGALISTKELAQDAFDLDMRIGVVPISDLNAHGKEVTVAKYKISNGMSIAMFSGGGLGFADNLIKNNEQHYSLENRANQENLQPANFSGLECRWNPIKATNGKMLTLLVQATEETKTQSLYSDILDKITQIYGEPENYQPNNRNNMSLSWRANDHKQEINVRTNGKGRLMRLIHHMNIYGIVIFGNTYLSIEKMFNKNKNGAAMDNLLINTDFQKFDDTLRMVIDSKDSQTKELRAYLEEQHNKGRCAYGTHISDNALMTCMIFDRKERHLHFIDGAQGGYALAAKKMKQRLKAEKKAA